MGAGFYNPLEYRNSFLNARSIISNKKMLTDHGKLGEKYFLRKNRKNPEGATL